MGHANAFAATRKLIKIATRVNEARNLAPRMRNHTSPAKCFAARHARKHRRHQVALRYIFRCTRGSVRYSIPAQHARRRIASRNRPHSSLAQPAAARNPIHRPVHARKLHSGPRAIVPRLQRIAREPIRPSCSTRKRTQAKRESRHQAQQPQIKKRLELTSAARAPRPTSLP